MVEDEKPNQLSNLTAYIERLELEKSESIKASNYDYTDQLNTRIIDTKKELAQVRKKQLLYQHNVEVDALDNSYKTELEDFNTNWDEKFKKLEDKSKNLEESLNDKHNKQMNELYEYLELKLPKNVKYSKAYYETKSQEESLVKLGKFKEAALLKKKLEEIEKADSDKFNKEKYEKIKSESVRTANKHMNEKSALRKKIEIEFEVLKKERQTTMEKLLLKYKNRKAELENQQKQELNYLENENLLKKKTTTNKLKNKKIISLNSSQFNPSNRSQILMKSNDKIPIFSDNKEDDFEKKVKYDEDDMIKSNQEAN